MMEISLCMIVKNEEEYLDNCLRSIHDLVDEIIIVDTGSTDRTKEIAAQYTGKIYDFIWVDDFAAARNFSFSKATKDYCMWLDADDILTEENRAAFLQLKKGLVPDIDYVVMPYHYAFAEDGRLTHSTFRERVVKKSNGFQWEGTIHESISCAGHGITSGVAITHTRKHSNSDRNFKILEAAVKKGDHSLRTLYHYAGELSFRDRPEEAIAHFLMFFAAGGHHTTHCLSACIRLHDLYLLGKQYEKALKVSLDCLPFCADRSEFCSQLGLFYLSVLNDLGEAVNWFNMAIQCPHKPQATAAYPVQDEYYYYIPYMQLGYTYCMLERYPEGIACFKEALKYNANSLDARNLMLEAYEKLTGERATPQ